MMRKSNGLGGLVAALEGKEVGQGHVKYIS